jgi:AraC family transcriptional regulator
VFGTIMAVLLDELTARRFARVRDYIEHNLGEAISLEDLARVAGVSRFHFARQFRAYTGQSPMGYLLRTRVERAKTLLRDSRARVVDISAELGFADQSHFARTFRRLVGMPPSAYARVEGRAAAGPPAAAAATAFRPWPWPLGEPAPERASPRSDDRSADSGR